MGYSNYENVLKCNKQKREWEPRDDNSAYKGKEIIPEKVNLDLKK